MIAASLPDVRRPDAEVVLVNRWFVGTPAAGGGQFAICATISARDASRLENASS